MGLMAGHPHLNSSSEAEFDRVATQLKPVKPVDGGVVASSNRLTGP